jgi:hypothetical protein
MITFAKFQQESFAVLVHRMINGVTHLCIPCINPLDDNKMITK